MYSAQYFSIIASIKEALPVLEAIRRYRPDLCLRRRGNKYWGLCPFHQEKHPSFMVNPNRGYCQCFGCGFWGDGLGFAAKALGLPLSETIRLVAADIGLSRETTPEQRSEALKITEGERRLRAQAATFEQVVGRAFRSAASLLRAAQAQTRNLKNEDDLDKPGLAEAFDAIVELEFLLDELDADDPARQYTALLWWERMINERKN